MIREPLGPRRVAGVLMPAMRSVGMSRMSLPCMIMHTSKAVGMVISAVSGVMHEMAFDGRSMHIATNTSRGPIRNATNGTPNA